VGDGARQIAGAATLRDAGGDDLAFVDHRDKVGQVSKSQAAAVLAPLDVVVAGLPTIQVADVPAAFAQIVQYFHPRRAIARIGIHPSAIVHASAVLAANVEVGPGVVIGAGVQIGPNCTLHSGAQIMADCRIGADTTIFSNAVLYENSRLGERVIVHAGAVLGAYGFGYKLADGRHQLSAQLGWVEVGSDVEIGACTTIDRGTYGATTIGEGTKIDNLVMIAHNCRIGKHNMICSQVGIAGSTSTGDYVVMAGQVGVRDHVHIGHRAILGAKSGVAADVPDGLSVLGAPAKPEREEKVLFAAIAKLPEMRRQIKELQRLAASLIAPLGPVPDKNAA
jgi:UDP-3-O-[3-hydroxymyristoyl] glucosamine N-acyltransferase